MRFEVLNKVFKEKAKVVAGFATAKNIGVYTKITALDDSDIVISIDNGTSKCEVFMKAAIEELGSIVIAYKELDKIIKATTDLKTLLFISENDDDLLIRGVDEDQDFEFRTKVVNIDIPDREWKTNVSFPFSPLVFVNMLTTTVPFISKDDGRPHLKGVRMENEYDALAFKATDGKRACLVMPKKNDDEDDIPPFEAITIPSEFIKEITKAFNAETKNFFVRVSKECIVLESDDIKMYSSLLIQGFPKTDKLVPKDFISHFTLSATELSRALTKISLCCENSNTMKMEVEPNSLEIKASENDKDVSVSMKCDYTGKKATLYFNYRFIQDVLSVYNGLSISFYLSGTNMPVLIEDDRATYIIMGINPKQ